MAEINLLNSERESHHSITASSKKWLLRLVTVIFVLAIAFYGYLFFNSWRTEKSIAKATKSVQEFQNTINNNSKRQELITRQGQLNAVNDLLDKHLSWSVILPELSRVTIRSAKYSNMDFSEGGSLELTVTLPSYAEADKYLQVFNLPQFNRQFSNVTVMSLTRGQDENLTETVLRLQLEYNIDFLKK